MAVNEKESRTDSLDDMNAMAVSDGEAQYGKTVNQEGFGNMFSATTNMTNAALGAGLLTFPRSFALTGITAGMLLQVALFIVVILGLNIFAVAAKITNCISFPSTCSCLLGKNAAAAATAVVMMYSWCGCTAYLTIIQTQLVLFGRILADVEDGCPVTWYFQPYFTVAVLGTLVIYPLSSLRNISTLAAASFLAVAACWYVTIFVVVSFFTLEPTQQSGSVEDCSLGETHAFETPSFLPVSSAVMGMCFGYQCHISSVPNYVSLHSKTRALYPYITIIGVFGIVLTYSTMGFAGAMTFGGCAGTKNLILDNYLADNLWANLGRVFIALAVTMSYPLVAFAGRLECCQMLDAVIASKGWSFSDRHVFLGNSYRRQFWLGTLWYVSTLLFAMFVPNIKWVINITGGTSASAIFIFPGLLAIRLSDVCSKDFGDDLNPCPAKLPYRTDSRASVRSRVTYWLNSQERRALKIFGVALVIVGSFLVMLGLVLVGIDIHLELQKTEQPRPSCNPA